jgi:hypothetical protein
MLKTCFLYTIGKIWVYLLFQDVDIFRQHIFHNRLANI